MKATTTAEGIVSAVMMMRAATSQVLEVPGEGSNLAEALTHQVPCHGEGDDYRQRSGDSIRECGPVHERRERDEPSDDTRSEEQVSRERLKQAGEKA